ncbi:tol-pal system YbgF family protein [candidate division KSB1 bacterium]
MRKLILICLVVLCHTNTTISQNIKYQINKELEFAEYLHQNLYFRDATFVLKKLNNKNQSNSLFSDSVNFLIGRSYFKLPEFDSAYAYFSLVKPMHPYYKSSKFCLSWMDVRDGHYQKAYSTLIEIETNDIRKEETKWFGLTTASLLNRDFEKYAAFSSKIKFNILAQEFEKLEKNADDITHYKNRSPFLAGLYSSIIPGAGKVYVGKTMEGISSFLIVGALGIYTYESYRIGGIKNFKTIIFGSVFSVFYVGNIWGSVLSLKRKNDEFKYEMEQNILNDYFYIVDPFVQ